MLGDELNFSSLKGMVNAVGGADTLEGVTKHKYLVKTTYAFLFYRVFVIKEIHTYNIFCFTFILDHNFANFSNF